MYTTNTISDLCESKRETSVDVTKILFCFRSCFVTLYSYSIIQQLKKKKIRIIVLVLSSAFQPPYWTSRRKLQADNRNVRVDIFGAHVVLRSDGIFCLSCLMFSCDIVQWLHEWRILLIWLLLKYFIGKLWKRLKKKHSLSSKAKRKQGNNYACVYAHMLEYSYARLFKNIILVSFSWYICFTGVYMDIWGTYLVSN